MLHKKLTAKLLAGIILSLTLSFSQVVYPQLQKPLSDVLESAIDIRIRKGKEVVLKNSILGSTIRAEAIRKWLTDPTIPEFGVRLNDATITGILDLENRAIPHEVQFNNCTFLNKIKMRGAHTKEDLLFLDCEFKGLAIFVDLRVDGHAAFNGTIFHKKTVLWNLEIGGDLNLAQSQFYGDAIFKRIKVATDLNCQSVNFKAADYGVNFENASVGGTFFLEDAIFKGEANFKFMRVQKNLQLSRVRFENPHRPISLSNMRIGGFLIADNALVGGPVHFQGTTVERDLIANGAQFTRGPVNFGHLQVHGDFDLSGATLQGWTKTNFSSMQVGQNFVLERSRFNGPVEAEFMQIDGNVQAQRAQFRNSHTGIDLQRTQVDREMDFTNALFRGPVTLTEASVGSNLKATRARFLCRRMGPDFSRMNVTRNLSLKDARFNGPAHFKGITVGVDLNMSGSQFENLVETADFSGTEIGGDALLDWAIFKGDVDFSFSEIGSSLHVRNANFSQRSFFSNMKVGKETVLDSTNFFGPTELEETTIAGILHANGTRFEDAARFGRIIIDGDALFQEVTFADIADFKNAEVSGRLLFTHSQFGSTLNLANATFQDIGLRGRGKDAVLVNHLNLSGSHVKRQLRVENTRVGALLASHLRVQGPSHLHDLRLDDYADLQFGDYQTLYFSDVDWPQKQDNLLLNGISYNYIGYDPEFKNSGDIQLVSTGDARQLAWKMPTSSVAQQDSLIRLVKRSRYSPEVHKSLENFFRQQGYPKANEVYILNKRRGLDEIVNLSSTLWGGMIWLWNKVLDFVSGYGRRPWLALLWAALIVAIGTLIYQTREGMELQDVKRTGSFKYNPVWYSFDLFVPFIDLRAAKIWIPRKDRRLARHYMRVHVCLGWILMTIGVASLTGLIR